MQTDRPGEPINQGYTIVLQKWTKRRGGRRDLALSIYIFRCCWVDEWWVGGGRPHSEGLSIEEGADKAGHVGLEQHLQKEQQPPWPAEQQAAANTLRSSGAREPTHPASRVGVAPPTFRSLTLIYYYIITTSSVNSPPATTITTTLTTTTPPTPNSSGGSNTTMSTHRCFHPPVITEGSLPVLICSPVQRGSSPSPPRRRLLRLSSPSSSCCLPGCCC